MTTEELESLHNHLYMQNTATRMIAGSVHKVSASYNFSNQVTSILIGISRVVKLSPFPEAICQQFVLIVGPAASGRPPHF